MDNFDLKKYLVENKLTAGSRLTEANSKPEIKVENDVMYLDYSGSVGTSSFGNLKSPIIKVMKAGEEPRDQKYMIYWKEDSKDWEWERGNMKRQLRNSIISYAKRYLPIIEDQNDLNEPKGSFGEPSDSDYFGNHIKENKLTAGSRLAENRIIIKTNGNRLAIDKKDLQRLKSGKDIVGYSIKYPGQEEWVLAKDKWEIEGPLKEAKKKKGEDEFNNINIGDKFEDEEGDVFTVVDVFVPEFTTDVESITLEDSDGIPTTYPDDFDDGEFFDWFSPIDDSTYDDPDEPVIWRV